MEKACTAIEEAGHHYTTSGNILDQNVLVNRKQEKRARAWGYERMVPLSALLEAYWAGITNRFELAEFLDITEFFLKDALNHYKTKYGLFFQLGDYLISFDPLFIVEKFKE